METQTTQVSCAALVQAETLKEALEALGPNVPMENVTGAQPIFPQVHLSFLYVKEPDGSYREIA